MEYVYKLSLITLLLMRLSLSGQTWDLCLQDNSEAPTHFISGNNYNYLFTNGKTQNLYAISKSGAIKFKKTIAFSPYLSAINLQGGLIAIYQQYACSQLINPNTHYFQTLDSLGNAIHTFSMSLSTGQQFSQILCLPDSGYVFHIEDKIYKLNKNLNLSDSLILPNYYLKGAVVTPTSIVFSILDKNFNGSYYHYRTDHQFNFIDSLGSPILFSEGKWFSNGMIFAFLKGGYIYRIKPDLSIPLSFQQPFPDAFNKIGWKNDTIYGLLYNSTVSSPTLCQIDTSAYNPAYYSTNRVNWEYLTFEQNQNNLYMIGKNKITTFGEGYNHIQHAYSTSLYSTQVPNLDLAKKDLTILKADVDSLYSVFFNGMVKSRFRLKLVIKNAGTNTVNKFKISTHEHEDTLCNQVYNQNLFTITLLPGQTTTITTPLLTHILPIPGDPHSIFFESCPYVSLPDNETDFDNNNNQLCTNTITSVNGLPELSDVSIKVHPIPTSNQLNVECNTPIRSITIWDLNGKMVLKTSPVNNENSIFLENLHSGIYFISINTDQLSVYKKIIINKETTH